ncbi:MAG: GTP-binding protein [Hydrococcus sp. RU_2_2]|nr:GTP-binding protein [Hydrococcus sp. RU_2_2]
MIIAVIGTPGSGKSNWIREQIAKTKKTVRYFSPQTESIPIDATLIESDFPSVQVLSIGQEHELFATSATDSVTYIELPWYLDLLTIEPLLQQLNCHRVAVMPPQTNNTGWHAWADEVIPGNDLEKERILDISAKNSLDIHRGILTGGVLDFTSLEVFWSELIQGAYGNIIRVKGIFDVIDGQSLYGEFVENLPPKEFKPLNLPLWVTGRSQRFSGFEIIGRNLAQAEISQTVKDCCLSESAIAYYQRQIQEEEASA